MGIIEIIHAISNYGATGASYGNIIHDMSECFEKIKEFEGYEPKIRPCPAGYYSIGYGINVHKKYCEPQLDRDAKIDETKIDKEKLLRFFPNYYINCSRIYEEDAEKAMITYIQEEILYKIPIIIPNTLSIHNKYFLYALTSLLYNIGINSGKTPFIKSRMLDAINKNDWVEAKKECDWGLHEDEVFEGIKKRRKWEQEQIEKGIEFARLNRIRKIY